MIAPRPFALGLFVTSTMTIGLNRTFNWNDLPKVSTAILSAIFAGAVFVYVESLAQGEVLKENAPYYAVGLVYGYFSYYASAATRNIRSSCLGLRVLGWLHVVGLFGSIVLGCLLFLSPSLRSAVWRAPRVIARRGQRRYPPSPK